MISHKALFFVSLGCTILNMLSFSVGARYGDDDLMGFTGFMALYCLVLTTVFFQKISKKNDDE